MRADLNGVAAIQEDKDERITSQADTPQRPYGTYNLYSSRHFQFIMIITDYFSRLARLFTLKKKGLISYCLKKFIR